MNNNTDQILNVLFASNNEFSPYLGVSLYSLLKHNLHDFSEIKIFVFDDNISEKNKNKINSIAHSFKSEIRYIKSKDIEQIIGEKTFAMYKDGVKSMTTYSRLFSSTLIPNVDKILYLDSDSLILNSFKDLWEMNFDEYSCAGVIDTLGIEYIKKEIDLQEKHNYVNGGFLLINLKKWRENNIETEFMEFLKEHNNKFIFHDQGILNGVLKNEILYLHPKYNLLGQFHGIDYEKAIKRAGYPNYYNKEIIEEAQKSPIFLHFCGGSIARPWKNMKHPFYGIYKNYYEKTPFKEEISANKEITKKEQLIYSIYQSKLLTIIIKCLPDSLSVKLANERIKKICENETENMLFNKNEDI